MPQIGDLVTIFRSRDQIKAQVVSNEQANVTVSWREKHACASLIVPKVGLVSAGPGKWRFKTPDETWSANGAIQWSV